MRLHAHAAGLVAILDPDWRRKIWLGGLLLLIPGLGWLAVLGFRSEFVRHLYTSAKAPLPDWNDRVLRHAKTGVKAVTVIFGYLLPLYLVVGTTVALRGFVPGTLSLGLAALFLVFPIFSTLSFPIACVALGLAREPWLTPLECVASLASYALLVFLLPAGFLQISRTGRYRSAFALWRTIPFVLRNLPAYLEAWWVSSVLSLVGHLALPLAPWGVVWCYLGIVLLFNEVLEISGGAPGTGWLTRAISDPRFQGRSSGGRAMLVDARGEPVAILDLGLFSAPLPRIFSS